MVLTLSCEKSNVADVDEVQSLKNPDPFSVPVSIADEVASAFIAINDTSNTDSKNLRKSRERKSTETVFDDYENPLYHITNFKEGGFVVVSADYRTIPIIAFNDSGELNYKRDRNVNGLAVWFDQAKEQIKEIKKSDEVASKLIEKAWKEYLSKTSAFPTDKRLRPADTNCQEWYEYGQFMCQNSTSTYGPYLTTNWGQSRVSTALLSTAKNCDGCNRYLAGCGPVAIGQVARFLRQSNTTPYNYAAMPAWTDNRDRFLPDPNNPRPFIDCDVNTYNSGQTEISRLMRDIGVSASSNYDYFNSCSTLTWPWKIGDGLNGAGVNGNNITMVTHNPGNYQTLKNELISGYPVIFVGYDPYDWGVFQNWHIWVCDGYKQQVYSEFDCSTLSCNTIDYAYLHMNWGWSGGSNGYFIFSSFAAGGSNYTNGLAFYKNIRS